MFKAPSLRNIILTPPYFHSGKVWSPKESVAMMGDAQLGITRNQRDVHHRVPAEHYREPAFNHVSYSSGVNGQHAKTEIGLAFSPSDLGARSSPVLPEFIAELSRHCLSHSELFVSARVNPW